MEVITLLVTILALAVFVWFQYKQSQQISELMNNPPQRQVMESPNQVIPDNSDTVAFDENHPLDLPKNVKFEVEGGDTVTPPGFEETSKPRATATN